MTVARWVALGPAHSAPPAPRAPWAFGTGRSVREVLLLRLQHPLKPQAGVVCIAGVPYTPPSQHVPARRRPHLWTRPLRPRPLRPGQPLPPRPLSLAGVPGRLPHNPPEPPPGGAQSHLAAEGSGWAWPAVTRFILTQPTMEVGKSRHGWVEGLAGCTQVAYAGAGLCLSVCLSFPLPRGLSVRDTTPARAAAPWLGGAVPSWTWRFRAGDRCDLACAWPPGQGSPVCPLFPGCPCVPNSGGSTGSRPPKVPGPSGMCPCSPDSPTDGQDWGPQEPHSKIVPLEHDVLSYIVGEASAQDAHPPRHSHSPQQTGWATVLSRTLSPPGPGARPPDPRARAEQGRATSHPVRVLGPRPFLPGSSS